ncbi:MAG: FkbM family methyltransferase [Cyanobacteria bacterium]|nr:FkbM family methyltransferase [Cyanobacteriota bacterium]
MLIGKLIQRLEGLVKPEYVFRPTQYVKRLLRGVPSRNEFEFVHLPWGLTIRVRPNDNVGSAIWRLGLYELVTSETIWRLLDKADCAVDIGANIGYMTGLMAKRVGLGDGKVWCFEPHVQLFEELTYNVDGWRAMGTVGEIEVHQAAVSNHHGTGRLLIPADFDRNRGLAYIDSSNSCSELNKTAEVALRTLDNLFYEKRSIQLLKVDVEGHEAAVFEGAVNLLSKHQIRDIIFEDFDAYPSKAMSFLEKHGYEISCLARSLQGPVLHAPNLVDSKAKWEPPAYLATIDAQRACARLKAKGWRVLSGR